MKGLGLGFTWRELCGELGRQRKTAVCFAGPIWAKRHTSRPLAEHAELGVCSESVCSSLVLHRMKTLAPDCTQTVVLTTYPDLKRTSKATTATESITQIAKTRHRFLNNLTCFVSPATKDSPHQSWHFYICSHAPPLHAHRGHHMSSWRKASARSHPEVASIPQTI